MTKTLTINPFTFLLAQMRNGGWLYFGIAIFFGILQAWVVLMAQSLSWTPIALGAGSAIMLTGVMMLPLKNFRAFGLRRSDYAATTVAAVAVVLIVVTLMQFLFIPWRILALELLAVVAIFAIYTAVSLKDERDATTVTAPSQTFSLRKPTLANRRPFWIALAVLVGLQIAVLLSRLDVELNFLGWVALPMLLGIAAAPFEFARSYSSWLAFGRTRAEFRNRNLINAGLLAVAAFVCGFVFNGTWKAGVAIFICAFITMGLVMLWNGGGIGLSVWSVFLMRDFVRDPELTQAYFWVMAVPICLLACYTLFIRPMRDKMPKAVRS